MNPVEVISWRQARSSSRCRIRGHLFPDDILAKLNDRGRALADTDWHVDRLYDGLLPNATIVRANFHRYVVDANRDPSGASLYPGLNTTGLCPLTDFDGAPIYNDGCEPDESEVERRRQGVSCAISRCASKTKIGSHSGAEWRCGSL